MKVLLEIHDRAIGILDEIGRKGLASGEHSQSTEYCIQKAISEFIEKYTGKNEYDFEYGITKKEIKEDV
jgi:hypothetical protein